ncbi:GTP-binding protein Rit1 [Nymphon striatum]|nr:GTP-binding protein Rit1 [Nymphon striatum]KAG1666324.1 GTP-binding protein Rit1 [Nymphon striatum]
MSHFQSAAETSSCEVSSAEYNNVQQQMTRGGIRVYKIVILGDGGVGKSEDAYQQQAVIDGEAALLDILDTAGQVEFTAMRDQYMRCGEGFIICYSITDRHSFDEVTEYKKLVQKVRPNEEIPVILVGNKYDLENQRTVSTEEGQTLASQFNCQFFETSAALRHFVDDVFHALVRQIRLKEKAFSSSSKVRSDSKKWKRMKTAITNVFKM